MPDDEPPTLDWNGLRCFRDVTRAGSLRAAAARVGSPSAATLARRIASLEQSVGCPLLERDDGGQRLTPAGAETLAAAERMHDATLALGRITAPDREHVRVAAGFWMTRFLATALPDLRRVDGSRIGIDWQAGVTAVDIRHRAAHIGIRNSRPDDPELAARPLGTIAFAVYRCRDSPRGRDAPEWLASVPGTPSAAWVDAQPGTVVTRVSDPLLVLPLLHADIGIAVLPCFAGDTDPRLERLGDPIAALDHRQWLVAQADDRARPAIRQTIDAIVDVTAASSTLLRGDRVASERDRAD